MRNNLERKSVSEEKNESEGRKNNGGYLQNLQNEVKMRDIVLKVFSLI